MSDDLVLRDEKDGLCTLTLNRPQKLNALNYDVFKALAAHIDHIEANGAKIGCVVLRGTGPQLLRRPRSRRYRRRRRRRQCREFRKQDHRAIERAAHAGRLRRAGPLPDGRARTRAGRRHSDRGGVRQARRHAWQMGSRARVGHEPAPAAPGRPRQGDGNDVHLAHLFGRQAEAMGLANFCVPDAELDAAVEAFTKEVLANSWRSNRANKKLLADTEGMTLKAALAHELHRSEGRGPEMAERLKRMRK
jgi:enoyl-CoA hydratase